jgi:hypothetical protein
MANQVARLTHTTSFRLIVIRHGQKLRKVAASGIITSIKPRNHAICVTCEHPVTVYIIKLYQTTDYNVRSKKNNE